MEYNLEKLVDIISNLKVQEVMCLVDMIEKKFNISHDILSSVDNKSTINNNITEIEEKQSLFCVFLNKIGKNKLSIIKLVRAKISNLGLKQAKDLVESCPVKLIEDVTKEEAELFKHDLVEAGAEVEIK